MIITPQFTAMRMKNRIEEYLRLFQARLYYECYLDFTLVLPTSLRNGSRIIFKWNNPEHKRLTVELTIGVSALNRLFIKKEEPEPVHCLIIGSGFKSRILKMKPQLVTEEGYNISLLGYYAKLARCVTDQAWECPDHPYESKNLQLKYLSHADSIAWLCGCGSWKPLTTSLDRRLRRYIDSEFWETMAF